MPCAALLLAALLLLARPLGHAFFEPLRSGWWPFWGPRLGHLPEPAEHAAYALGLAAPVALAAVVVLAARRGVRLPRRAVVVLVQASAALLVAFLVVVLAAQQVRTFGVPYGEPPFKRVYFTPATWVVAALLAAGAVVALRRERLLARIGDWTRETRGRRLVAFVVALLVTAVWILPGLHTEGSIATDSPLTYLNIPFWLDEPFAVLDGRYPLVDFHAQYAQLMPYLAAAVMAVFGTTLGVYTVACVVGNALGMLAVYALLRRVVRRSLLALGLFLPVLATGFFTEAGPPENRHGPVTLISMFPMRYVGAYALAWLTARHLDGAAPRRLALLSFAGGIVLVNNVEFGLPAYGATVVALVLADPARVRARAGRFALELAAGLLGAAVAAMLLTLAVAGSLPHFGMMLTFARLYGVDGWANIPMPTLGLHLAVYVTFAAAIVTAVVRACSRARDRLLTAMLGWAGVFGFGAGAYFAGRSLPEVLISIFSAWALALALLLVVVVKALARRPARRPTLAELAVLLGFGVAVCSLAQTPTPWSQIERLERSSAQPAYAHTPTERFVDRSTDPGERVLILAPLGHRIAYDLGLVNVSPYSFIEAMPLERHLDEAVAALRAAGGRKLFLPLAQTYPEQLRALERAGFGVSERGTEQENLLELVDARATG